MPFRSCRAFKEVFYARERAGDSSCYTSAPQIVHSQAGFALPLNRRLPERSFGRPRTLLTSPGTRSLFAATARIAALAVLQAIRHMPLGKQWERCFPILPIY